MARNSTAPATATALRNSGETTRLRLSLPVKRNLSAEVGRSKPASKRNIGILIISHSLDQVFKLSDHICVLRRGRQIGVRKTSETDKNEIIAMITGLH